MNQWMAAVIFYILASSLSSGQPHAGWNDSIPTAKYTQNQMTFSTQEKSGLRVHFICPSV